MAFAKKCDICGKLHELYNVKHDKDKTNGLVFVNIDSKRSYFTNDVLDCCPECMQSIRNHVESLKSPR